MLYLCFNKVIILYKNLYKIILNKDENIPRYEVRGRKSYSFGEKDQRLNLRVQRQH